MRKSLLTLVLSVIFLAPSGGWGLFAQTIYRCNNDPSVTLSPNMFRTLQEAHDAAAAGDIIYVEPSFNSQSYGDLVCTKTLKIIGNGYFHTSNSNLINIPFFVNPSQIETVTINSTAIGTILQGVSFNNVNVKAQNVKIERCYAGNGTVNLIRDDLGSNASGATIAKNFLITIVFSGYYENPVSPSCSYTDYQIENVTIKNNLHIDIDFQSSTILRRGGNCAINNSHIEVPSLKNSTISNNTNYSVIKMYGENTTYQNNICEYFYLQGTVGFPSNFITASNNVCISACGYGNNNVQNILLSSLYTVSSPSPSTDNNYRLSPTSPAKNAGLGGVDAGAFGTNDPYRLSGLAPIPQITSYSKNASSGVYTTSTPMTVTISVRGNN